MRIYETTPGCTCSRGFRVSADSKKPEHVTMSHSPSASLESTLASVPMPHDPGHRPRLAKARAFKIREDHIERIEVHVASICMREGESGWRVLIAQRSPDRELFPGKWECGGGMVRSGENFETAIRRQVFEEFGLHARPLEVLELYEIHTADPLQPIIPGVRFLCQATHETVRLNRREFSRYEWVSFPVPNRDFIGSLAAVLQSLAARLHRDSQDGQRVKRIGFQT